MWRVFMSRSGNGLRTGFIRYWSDSRGSKWIARPRACRPMSFAGVSYWRSLPRRRADCGLVDGRYGACRRLRAQPRQNEVELLQCLIADGDRAALSARIDGNREPQLRRQIALKCARVRILRRPPQARRPLAMTLHQALGLTHVEIVCDHQRCEAGCIG